MIKKLLIECDFESESGRHIAEVVELPGVMAYGETREQALLNAQALALQVIAHSVQAGLIEQAWLDQLFTVDGRPR